MWYRFTLQLHNYFSNKNKFNDNNILFDLSLFAAIDIKSNLKPRSKTKYVVDSCMDGKLNYIVILETRKDRMAEKDSVESINHSMY